MIEHGKVYVCAGCRVPAPLMFRIDGDRTMCRDCVKNCIAELEATIARVRELPAEWKLAASPEDREGLEMAADDLLAELTPATEAPK